MIRKTFEQLVNDRKELIEVHKKNDFTDGIHALLTDLYPDTAHFIYELLQNAEDMNASVVRFTLSKNSIEFEHNGTKRDFNIEDIDAINGLFEQIMQKEVIEGDSERIVLSIELDGKRQEIRYIPKHFLALKAVMRLIENKTK